LLHVRLRGIQLDGALLFITHDEGNPAFGRLRNHRAFLALQHRPPISLHAARKPSRFRACVGSVAAGYPSQDRRRKGVLMYIGLGTLLLVLLIVLLIVFVF
jgi:hypothetical protein